MASPDPSFREFVQTLKDALRIEDVIRDYVPSLHQAGASMKGLCPFHKEKTPSFYVHPEMGFYHCFGCGAHGDAIKFVQEIEKIDFKLAIEQLARRAGLQVPAFKGGREKSEDEDRRLEQLRELCNWAGEFFIEQMRVHPRGPLARKYLRERGLTDAEIKTYRLGYAPDGWEILINAAEKRGWKPETVVEAGLASRRDNGGFTDRFRDRVIFPIVDRVGQLVAFAGRLIENKEDAPKYINSAETPLFKKNQLLYGLHAAREPIRETGAAILLEGYMDWLTLHRHGVQNVLAGMGTALTEEQARLLKRMSSKVILLYDADAAGQKAMFRSTELLLRQGVAVHAAVLPGNHDPDSFLVAEGTQAIREILAAAPLAIDYFIRHSAETNDLGRPEGKAAAVEHVAPLILALEDPILREAYSVRAAASLGLRPETMEQALKRRGRRRTAPSNEAVSAPEAIDQEITPSRTEQNLLYILLQRRECWDLLQELDPEWFQHPLLRQIYERVYENQRDVREGAEPPADWFELFQDDATRHEISKILLLPMRRFGGEVADFNQHIHEALRLQIFKMVRQETQRRKRQLSQDLQLILAEKPLGEGQLAQIDQLSRENLEQVSQFFGQPPGRTG